ncbi:OmpA family protein [Haliangium ochraceum]|uniref:OmpA/MotB domain protein n=1 Tax=Haliangium ochraceum (strain DSM 14365 / JCM 11303 / SMP-2) TaxID=502025 RepID=D0LXS5_HALO1|nr:OmpA family protein [Haliangium ochraceum]ACY14280.1 OmpA/MotB domain protein [Haliangium ochraceum DSM 14365]
MNPVSPSSQSRHRASASRSAVPGGLRSGLALLTAGLGMTLLAPSASAQQMDTDVPLERFRLATDESGVLDVEWAKVPAHLDWGLAVWLDAADDPLTAYVDGPEGRERVGSVVSRRLSASLLGHVALWDRAQIGVELPLLLSQASDDLPGLDGASGAGLGDIRLLPKLQLLDAARAGVHLAVMPVLTLPTGTGDVVGNEAGFAFSPEIIASRAFGPVRLTSSLGYHARKDVRIMDLEVEDELFARFGAGYRFADRASGGPPLTIDATFSTATSASSPFDVHNQNYAELHGGVSYRFSKDLIGLLAGTFGVQEGFGTPDWRAVAGVRWSPLRDRDRDGDGLLDDQDACPSEAEDIDGFADSDGCPDLDNDGDGIPDLEDGAPNEPEDRDGFEDGDGVPDRDNDGDGINDDQDACPLKAETQNGFQDDDGCPDVADSDGDGLADDVDACPEQAEDMDSFQDEDGCPEENDRDGDTVLDRQDTCPDEPGKPEFEGCPTKPGAALRDGSIEIIEKVYFPNNQARILPRSFPVLKEVARVLNNHPDIELRVEGHTDDRGNDTYNRKLSQRRADSVVAFLVEQGIAAERLSAKGFGEERPIADNASAQGRDQNRRVEFVITNGDGEVQAQ